MSDEENAPTGGSEKINLLIEEAQQKLKQLEEFFQSATNVIKENIEKSKSELAEISQLKTDVAEMKGNIEAGQQSANADVSAVKQVKTELDALKSDATALAQSVKIAFQDISSKVNALQTQETELQQTLASLNTIKASAEAEKSNIDEIAKQTEGTSSTFESLKIQATERQNILSESQDALKEKIDEIESAHAIISSLQKTLLETNSEKKSVKDKIEELQTKAKQTVDSLISDRNTALADIETFRATSEERRNSLFASLESRILELLPSAGAAGLAHTYFDAKSRYSPTAFSKISGRSNDTGRWQWFRRKLGYNPSSVLATVVFYSTFFIPLLIIALESFRLLLRLDDPKFVLTSQMLLLRVLIALPLATMSAFGFASLQLYRRLFEEYNHKQRVMELYRSFKAEVDQNGSDDHKKLLLTIMLNSVAEKALNSSKEEEKGEKNMMTRIDQVLGIAAKVKSVSG